MGMGSVPHLESRHEVLSEPLRDALAQARAAYVEPPSPHATQEQSTSIQRNARATFRQSAAYERDLAAELIASRRAEADLEDRG